MSNTELSVTDLEAIYDRLAEAITAAGEEKEALFLTKLALLLANQLGDREAVDAAIDEALLNL